MIAVSFTEVVLLCRALICCLLTLAKAFSKSIKGRWNGYLYSCSKIIRRVLTWLLYNDLESKSGCSPLIQLSRCSLMRSRIILAITSMTARFLFCFSLGNIPKCCMTQFCKETVRLSGKMRPKVASRRSEVIEQIICAFKLLKFIRDSRVIDEASLSGYCYTEFLRRSHSSSTVVCKMTSGSTRRQSLGCLFLRMEYSVMQLSPLLSV